MKKTCTNCGSQAFHVEIVERPTMPRKPELSGYEQVPLNAECIECGERYSL